MLPTAPSFLFLFLPAVMAIYALIPADYRRYAILLFNITNYVIAVWTSPSDLLLVFLTSAFTYSAGFLIAVTHRRATLIAAIAVDVAAFLIFRLTFDYADSAAHFPFAAAIYLLASISYLIDIYRNDAPHAKNIGELLTYMLFFPTLIIGPIIRYKDFRELLDNIAFSLENFAEGIRLFVRGFLSRISIAAVLGYMLDGMDELPETGHSFSLALLYLLLLCATAYFSFAGYSSMARGIMYMLGIPFAPDFSLRRPTAAPTDLPRRFFSSLNRWIEDYLIYPILRLQKLPPYVRRILAVCISCLVPVLWLKTRWYVLIPILPMLVWRIVHILRESGRRHRVGKGMLMLGRVCYALLFGLCLAGMWYTIVLPDAATGLEQLRNLTMGEAAAVPHSIYAVLAYVDYLVVGLLGLLCCFFLRTDVEPQLARLPRPLGIAIRSASLCGLMSCFIFSLLHFLPQFPQYATRAFANLVF